MPDGATQGTLEVDWTGNSVLAAADAGAHGRRDRHLERDRDPDDDRWRTLLQNTGLTNSTQLIVGLVGSTTDPYAALAVTPGGSYTLQATFTSDVAPTDTSIEISTITDDSSDGACS